MGRESPTSSLAGLLTPLLASAQPNGGGPGPVLGIVEILKLFSIDPQTRERQPAALPLCIARLLTLLRRDT